jgi:transcription-repair coupling factor (superfamily II helicase)
MLEETIRQLKGEDLPERVEPEIKLRVPAFVPEEYVKDPNQRLVIYKKLTQAETEEEIADMADELADRFGKLPLAATYLLDVMRLRIGLKALLVKEVEFDGSRLIFSFHPKTPVSPDVIVALIRKEPRKFQFTPDYRLLAETGDTSFDGVLAEARNVLKRLN